MADRRLQVFHTVAKLLSFTKAAEVLHMTQPAVTFQVRQLEEHFNTRLFDRTHNRVTLTRAGETVYTYARRIFDQYDEMENSVREITGEVSGVLTIGASTTVAEYMLPSLLGKFKAVFPDIRLSLKVSNTENVVAMVEDNVIDLAVVEAPVNNKHLLVEVCDTDALVVVAHPDHEVAGFKGVSAAQLIQYPYICREEGSGTRDVIKDYMALHDISSDCLNVCLELGSPESIKGAVEAGMGIAILSKVTISKELALGTLVGIPLDPPLERPFSFVRQRQKFRQTATEKLLDFAHEYCKQDRA
jgi:DNA-binding transcriptional LysR family regulator